MPKEPIFSFAALQNRLKIRGHLVAQTALRIGAGRSSDINGTDLPVLRDSLGAPFVPGASLKGAFRARIESFVRAIQPDQAFDLLQIEAHMHDMIMQIPENDAQVKFLVGASKLAAADQILSNRIWTKSTLIDLTFGAPWIAGRIFFKDALVDRSLWFEQFEIRNGVALNRDTETVEQGLLYDYEVVPAGMRFGFELVLENAAPWQLGMMLLALRPWQAGDVQIGGFRSRGLGHVQLIDVAATYSAVEGDTAERADAVLAMLGHGSSKLVELPLAEPDERMKTWFTAFRQALIDPQAAIEEGATFDA
ncbi:CRISPR-associated protein Csm3 [Kouleothrix aurantiaca]|uniref:CRISPR-associated protein Csm3 n=1 Tax=Kouleothrix aurantiaca TaxID=186479 RepID=A0A0P9FLQ5_9CHLR|nr:CRISPR-associated protein Csm3 [Kouleothrix aurantiaca]